MKNLEPRQDITLKFIEEISKTDIPRKISVLLIGGSEKEPELRAIQSIHEISKITFAGIELILNQEWFYLDANEPLIDTTNKFDLILCSQVLEHLWNLPQAFQNITNLLNHKGLAWIACPASNFLHGSPDFYSSGYDPEMLKKLSSHVQLETLASGYISNKRIYYFRHLLQVWPSNDLARLPFITHFPIAGSLFHKIFWQIISLPERFCISLASSKTKKDWRFQLETWALVQKP
jgi:SAM-dependent methyltransferase